jgi:hypothetical protein
MRARVGLRSRETFSVSVRAPSVHGERAHPSPPTAAWPGPCRTGLGVDKLTRVRRLILQFGAQSAAVRVIWAMSHANLAARGRLEFLPGRTERSAVSTHHEPPAPPRPRVPVRAAVHVQQAQRKSARGNVSVFSRPARSRLRALTARHQRVCPRGQTAAKAGAHVRLG